MVKVVTVNANNKVELTKEELEAMLNESYEAGYSDGMTHGYQPTIIPGYQPTTIPAVTWKTSTVSDPSVTWNTTSTPEIIPKPEITCVQYDGPTMINSEGIINER